MKKKAFVVGANGNILKHAVSDAKNITNSFGQHGYIVNSPNVSLFKSTDFILALKEFVDDLEPDDLFIYYFVGHSFLGNNNVLTFLIDSSDPNDLKSCIGAPEIIYPIQQCRANNKLIVLDSCHSSALIPDVNLELRNVNYGVICATVPWHTTPELWMYPNLNINGGFLSHFFNKAISGEEDKALNSYKELTPDSLKDWLSRIIKSYHSYGVPPFRIVGSYSSSFVIAGFNNLDEKNEIIPVQELQPFSRRVAKLEDKISIGSSLRLKIYKDKLGDLKNQFSNLEEEMEILRADLNLEMDGERKLKWERRIENKQNALFEIVNQIDLVETKIN